MNYCVESNIKSSVDDYTDVCSLKFPNKFSRNNEKIIAGFNNVFQRGNPIQVWTGYFPNPLKDESGCPIGEPDFTGYIKSVKPDSVIELICEDEMFIFKQKTIRDFSKKDTTLKDLIKELLLIIGMTTIKYEVIDANIGTFVINTGTMIDVFETLKNQFGLRSFFQGGILKIRYATDFNIGEAPTTKNFYFEGKNANIFPDNSLNYVRKDDLIDMAIKGESIDIDTNKRIERWAYYDSKGNISISTTALEGSQKDFKYVNMSVDDLKKTIKNVLPTIIYEGYHGNFKTFGEPKLKHGNLVYLHSSKYPERDGKYLIKSVEQIFSLSDGLKQTVEIAYKN